MLSSRFKAPSIIELLPEPNVPHTAIFVMSGVSNTKSNASYSSGVSASTGASFSYNCFFSSMFLQIDSTIISSIPKMSVRHIRSFPVT